MKLKLAVAACLSAAMFIAGCDISEADKTTYAQQGGQMVGIFFNTLGKKVAAKDRNTIIEVVQTVSDVLPVDSTYEVTWIPVATDLVNKYTEAGKIDKDLAPIILSGCTLVARGIDFVFVKHTDWKKDRDDINTIVKSFVTGFTTIVTPANTLQAVKLDENRKILVDPVELYQFVAK